MNFLSKHTFGGAALIGLTLSFGAPSNAADIGADVYNTPSRVGNVEVYAVKASIDRSLTSTSGQVGGGRVVVDSAQIDKGAKTGGVANSAFHQGNAKIMATGDVTLGSILVESGVKTADLKNAPRRTGDITVYAGCVAGSAGVSGLTGELCANVVIDSIKVCTGAATKNIVNAPSMTGKTTVFGGATTVSSVQVGC